MGEAVCVWDLRAYLGEGPVWVAEEQALWFVDIKGCKIHRFHPESGDKQTWDTPEPCGFLAPVEGGRRWETITGAKSCCSVATGVHLTNSIVAQTRRAIFRKFLQSLLSFLSFHSIFNLTIQWAQQHFSRPHTAIALELCDNSVIH